MAISTGGTALATRAHDGWSLWELAPPEAGEPGVAVKTPGGMDEMGVARAFAPEEGKPACLARSPRGVPGAFATRRGKPENPDIGGEPCWGAHPLCSRIYCGVILKEFYAVHLSGFDDSCLDESVNGVFPVRYVSGCTWVGGRGGVAVELHFLAPTGQVGWQLVFGEEEHEGVACSDPLAPHDPRNTTFTLIQSPCGAGLAGDIQITDERMPMEEQ